MALTLTISSSSLIERPPFCTKSDFLPSTIHIIDNLNRNFIFGKKPKNGSLSISCSSPKLVRDRSLDKHVVRQNKIRFVQKLRTLLLSKPKHFLPLHILAKCRSYLTLSKPRSILSMIHRYPMIFELFTIPYPLTPMNATKPYNQLCVRLTPAVEALSMEEARAKSASSISLATKLQKLLMLASHRRLLLSKLVHLGPDLGLPPNFRSRLCSDFPEKFKIIDTSYGRALELVSWDPELAHPLPQMKTHTRELIVDRPLKFKHLKLRKGLNLKRHHHDFLIKFKELPDLCPYKTRIDEFPKESLEMEKRACNVVREVLGMTVEKKSLVDHLTHFRKDFGLSNKLRGMLLRHPELFYISLKGQRDSVFLVEAYDENGEIIEKDEALIVKDRLLGLVREGKRIRRERKRSIINGEISIDDRTNTLVGDTEEFDDDDEFDDLLEGDISEFETFEDEEAKYGDAGGIIEEGKFWTTQGSSKVETEEVESLEYW